MSAYKKIGINQFNYFLPEGYIAKYPLAQRDSSKLLVWQNGSIEKAVFREIGNFLPEDSLLIFNNTRVIHARLLFRKQTGALIEIFCLEPEDTRDYQVAFGQRGKSIWRCMVGNAKKWKEGYLVKSITDGDRSVELKARKRTGNHSIASIEFTWDPEYTFAEVLEKAGVLPIPPYLHRETEPEDEVRYQTVYAKNQGSVAAPTAGLHFTENVLRRLQNKNIATREITLHVGAGTFRPVKSETIEEHAMHQEQVVIPLSFIEELIDHPRKTIAVGTTSVRSLESLFWLGQKLETSEDLPSFPEIQQWEPYLSKETITARKALMNIRKYMNAEKKEVLRFTTRLIIVPGYEFRMTEGMITNFHQPKSTLLLLIGAFLGNQWREVYNFALNNDFRFLSYGDSNLYLK